MSTPPPIPCMFDGEAFRPLPNFLRKARDHYGAGEVVPMVPWEDRSTASHNHLFAEIHQAWQSLPERYALQPWAQSSAALRKHALISTGHCDVEAFVCMFKTEAERLAAALRKNSPDYAVIVVDGRTVTRLTAKSMSRQAMDKGAFQQAKDDILGFIADLLEVTPEQLSTAARGREGDNPSRRAAA